MRSAPRIISPRKPACWALSCRACRHPASERMLGSPGPRWLATRFFAPAAAAICPSSETPAVERFRRQHPKVRICIVQAETPEDVRDAIRAGEAELGLTDEVEKADRDVFGELILEQEMVAVLPPGSPSPPRRGAAAGNATDDEPDHRTARDRG